MLIDALEVGPSDVIKIIFNHPFCQEITDFQFAKDTQDLKFDMIRVSKNNVPMLVERGFRFSNDIGEENFIILDRALTGVNVRIDLQGHRNCLLILQAGLHLELDAVFEADSGLIVIRGGWHKLDCRLRDIGCAIVIDHNCSIGGASIWVEGDGKSVVIGEGCLFAWDINVRTGDSHAIISLETGQKINEEANIQIRRNVWVGHRVTILKKSTIGEGSIISTMSLVTGSIASFCVAGGVPAKIIKRNVGWTNSRKSASKSILGFKLNITRLEEFPMDETLYRLGFLGLAGVDAGPAAIRKFSEILHLPLSVTVWDFGMIGKSPWGRMRLMPDGKIEDYSSPNERFWRLTDNDLVFLNDFGLITTVFSEIRKRPDGRLAVIGEFKVESESTIHHLVKVVDGGETVRLRQPRPANPLWFDSDSWRIDVVRSGGLGDVLMTAAVLREFKMLYPDVQINFYTNYHSLFVNSQYIDKCLPTEEAPKFATQVAYDGIMPSPHHVARLIAYQLGLNEIDVRPECPINKGLSEFYTGDWANMPRPYVVVQRRSNRDFTPNKDWPEQYWLRLIQKLCVDGSVIEIGHAGEGGPPLSHQNYRDLRGHTSVEQLIAVVAAGDVYVGPPSGPLHIAAAVGKPIVSIIGGFESPSNTEYEGTISFGTTLPCAPCALVEPCPFGVPCLRSIPPSRVFSAVQEHWRSLNMSRLSANLQIS